MRWDRFVWRSTSNKGLLPVYFVALRFVGLPSYLDRLWFQQLQGLDSHQPIWIHLSIITSHILFGLGALLSLVNYARWLAHDSWERGSQAKWRNYRKSAFEVSKCNPFSSQRFWSRKSKTNIFKFLTQLLSKLNQHLIVWCSTFGH
jgi:hypothetical protein